MFDLSTAAAIALKTSLLIAAAGLLASLMARQSAAWRHLLLSAALALSVAMPFAVAYLPSSVQLSLPLPAAAQWMRDEARSVTGARRVEAEPEAFGPRESLPATAEPERRRPWPTAMIIWLIGAAAVLLRNLLAHVGLIRWTRAARSELSPAWAMTLRGLKDEAELRRRLRVLETDRTGSACTWGFLRPVVLLPAAGFDWPEPQRRFTLLHEIAHVRRLDYLTTQISNLACALHWYNPLVWFAAARARKLQEQACDDVVLNAGGIPSDYASFLVSVAGGSRRLSLASPAAVGIVQRSQLHGRVTAILDASRTRLPVSGVALFAAAVPLTCLMIVLATVSAGASPVAMRPGVPLEASFSSVELRHGGDVTLFHGPSPRVTLLRGDPKEVGITIRDDGRLVIDRCAKECSRRHDLAVEVETPGLAAVAVTEGGTIQSRGDFPPQPQIDVSVTQGGTIDVRSMAAESVAASVYSGGRIFTKPRAALSARVDQGGIITYWGDAVVESSVPNRGVVVEGDAADADRPLDDSAGR